MTIQVTSHMQVIQETLQKTLRVAGRHVNDQHQFNLLPTKLFQYALAAGVPQLEDVGHHLRIARLFQVAPQHSRLRCPLERYRIQLWRAQRHTWGLHDRSYYAALQVRSAETRDWTHRGARLPSDTSV